MAEVILKAVGSNKISVIKAYREITGLGLGEAKQAIDAVEAGTPMKIEVKSCDVSSVVAQLREAGAVVAGKGAAGGSAFDSAVTGDAEPGMTESSFFTDSAEEAEPEEDTVLQPVQKPVKRQRVRKMNKEAEQEELPDVSSVSSMGREETMDLLVRCGKIAKEQEELVGIEQSIKNSIAQEQKKADEIASEMSQKAWWTIFGITIASLIIFSIFLTIFGGIIVAVIVFMLTNKIVSKKDLEIHAEENEAKAREYSEKHIRPLMKKLEETQSKLAELWSSGKVRWAMDIVSEDLFMTESIKELYELIKNRRADNLKEALNLYDSAKHRERMEEMQQAIREASEISAVEAAKQSAQMKQIEKNTHQTATAAKWTAAASYGTYRNTKKINKNTKQINRTVKKLK